MELPTGNNLADDAEQYATVSRLLEELNRLRRLWTGFQPAPPLKRSDLTLLGSIRHLSEEGKRPVKVGQLALLMKQSAPAISQKLNELEAAGLVSRAGDESDRRVVYVALTEEGLAVTRRTMKEFLGRMQQALTVMGEEKTGLLLQTVQEFCDAIEIVQNQEGAETT